jgi:hypothetical protein
MDDPIPMVGSTVDIAQCKFVESKSWGTGSG